MNHIKATRPFRMAFIAALIVFEFGALSAFFPFLHNHEFNLAHVEKACAPCQWVQSHITFDVPSLDLTVSWFFQSPLLIWKKIFLKELVFSFSSRGPPLLS